MVVGVFSGSNKPSNVKFRSVFFRWATNPKSIGFFGVFDTLFLNIERVGVSKAPVFFGAPMHCNTLADAANYKIVFHLRQERYFNAMPVRQVTTDRIFAAVRQTRRVFHAEDLRVIVHEMQTGADWHWEA